LARRSKRVDANNARSERTVRRKSAAQRRAKSRPAKNDDEAQNEGRKKNNIENMIIHSSSSPL